MRRFLLLCFLLDKCAHDIEVILLLSYEVSFSLARVLHDWACYVVGDHYERHHRIVIDRHYSFRGILLKWFISTIHLYNLLRETPHSIVRERAEIN